MSRNTHEREAAGPRKHDVVSYCPYSKLSYYNAIVIRKNRVRNPSKGGVLRVKRARQWLQKTVGKPRFFQFSSAHPKYRNCFCPPTSHKFYC